MSTTTSARRPPVAGLRLPSVEPLGPLALARRFWPYARPLRRLIALAVLAIAIQPLLDAIAIVLFARIVDDVVVAHSLDGLPQLAGLFAVVALLRAATAVLDDLLVSWTAERLILEVRSAAFARLQVTSFETLDRQRLGDTLSRLSEDIEAIERLAVSGLMDGLSYAERILVFGGLLGFVAPGLALAVVVLAPLLVWASRRVSRAIRVASRERRRAGGALVAIAEESVANAALVRSYQHEAAELDRYKNEAQKVVAAEMSLSRLRTGFEAATELGEIALLLGVVAFGTWQIRSGAMSEGGLLAALAALTRLASPARGLGRLGTTLHATAASAERVVELLDAPDGLCEPPSATTLRGSLTEIRFDRVGFRYGGRTASALEDVSFVVRRDEMVAIVGSSGAGKSTIARLVLRLDDPSQGSVRFDGFDARELTIGSVRASTAAVLQECLVFDTSVRENIAIGRPGATNQEIAAAAEMAGATEFIEALPGGYDTRVGQRGRLLSGGQRQRIAIARALLRDAPVLLLDEPTAGLDAATAATLMGPLCRARAGRATVLISHDLTLVNEADEILVLEGGRIVERGTHSDLLARRGAYAALLAAGQLTPGSK